MPCSARGKGAGSYPICNAVGGYSAGAAWRWRCSSLPMAGRAQRCNCISSAWSGQARPKRWQRAVGAPGARQAEVVREAAQAVAGRIGVYAARQQHGAGERMGRGEPGVLQFGLPELAVECGVVGHHGRVAHEARGLAHHCGGIGGGLHHGIRDAGELRDEGRDPHARAHQALVAVHHAVAFHEHDGHLGGACTLGRHHAGGFEIDDGDGGGRHAGRQETGPAHPVR